MSITKNIEVGKWNKLPHYCAIGQPSDFYVYVDEDGFGKSSDWIKGKTAFSLWNELRKIKDKKLLGNKIKSIYEEHKKHSLTIVEGDNANAVAP
jgi:hypothetical protein